MTGKLTDMSAAYMRRCARKKRYEDKVTARSARASLSEKRGVELCAYRCDQCLGWHIGRPGGAFITRERTGKRPNKRMRGRV